METKPFVYSAIPLAALLLSGCEQALRVEVAQQGGIVSFAAHRVASSGPVCLDDIQIMAVGSGDPRSVWHIHAMGPATCVERVTYPQLPVSFAQDAVGAPFTKGQIYSVSVKIAPDLSGAQLFVPGDHDGDIGAGG